MDKVDRLLLDWHEWELGWEPVAGYGRDDATCAMFQSSRQWMSLDDLNDEVERGLLEATARIVGPLVMALDVRPRLAVNTAVRNLHAGFEVWINPRFPESQDEDYALAKDMLGPKLVTGGLLTVDDLTRDTGLTNRNSVA
ncbi:hypothetical protein [Paraburkholderia adhaesiva]|uniref:hypothetical protein n=1 Tax=Paraburkholderia adhaesiva TaxID=2883244 RepID=UPI001F24C307|nr:hypothetical protein [Paraburkholderia adhaesiva]